MSLIPNSTLLSQMSIPGTHDTMSYPPGLNPGGNGQGTDESTAITQDLTLEQQLDAGIRFLDIRLEPDGDALGTIHGIVSLGGTFKTDVIKTCTAFLEAHPTETIIMSVNGDDIANIADPTIYDSTILRDTPGTVVKSAQPLFYTKPIVPTLGEVRGEIVLLRRYSDPRPFYPVTYPQAPGIDVTEQAGWKSGPTPATIPATYPYQNRGSIIVQDNYDDPELDEKWKNISDMLGDARASTNQYNWYINFTSYANADITI